MNLYAVTNNSTLSRIDIWGECDREYVQSKVPRCWGKLEHNPPPPEEPKVWEDQINPKGEGDIVRDYKEWLECRLPNTVKKALEKITRSVEKRVKARCCSRGNIPADELKEISFGVTDEVITQLGDEPYSVYEKYLQIGSFSFYVKDVKIDWKEKSYTWTATAYAEDLTGVTSPRDENANALDSLLSIIPNFAKGRSMIFAEYPISGAGKCE